MHRIDGAGHVNGRFVAEDPATSRPPTEITPEIMNALQEEIASLIEWVFGEGSLEKLNNTQLRQALLEKFALLESPVFIGDPRAPTAKQFDNDQSIATTGFVKRALGNLSGVTGVNANATLTAEHAGQLISLFGVGGFTVTLPLGATVPVGTALQFFSVQSPGNVALVRQGADLISVAANTITGMTLWAGDSVTLVWSGSAWTAWGEMQLPHSPLFGSSLASSGYQKLPSGKIEQWMSMDIPANSSAVLTYPIAFPSECLSITTSHQQVSGAGSVALVTVPTTTQVTIKNQYSGAVKVFINVVGK